MKKIITLALVAASTISVAAAQSRDQKDFAFNKPTSSAYDQYSSYGGYGDKFMTAKEKDFKIMQITKDFDQRIDAVKFNRRMSGWEKSKQIQSLQNQKQFEIKKVEQDFQKSQHISGHGKRW